MARVVTRLAARTASFPGSRIFCCPLQTDSQLSSPFCSPKFQFFNKIEQDRSTRSAGLTGSGSFSLTFTRDAKFFPTINKGNHPLFTRILERFDFADLLCNTALCAREVGLHKMSLSLSVSSLSIDPDNFYGWDIALKSMLMLKEFAQAQLFWEYAPRVTKKRLDKHVNDTKRRLQSRKERHLLEPFCMAYLGEIVVDVPGADRFKVSEYEEFLRVGRNAYRDENFDVAYENHMKAVCLRRAFTDRIILRRASIFFEQKRILQALIQATSAAVIGGDDRRDAVRLRGACLLELGLNPAYDLNVRYELETFGSKKDLQKYEKLRGKWEKGDKEKGYGHSGTYQGVYTWKTDTKK